MSKASGQAGEWRPTVTALRDVEQVEIRRDFVEVSMDLSSLVAALGPDILLDGPKVFRGEANRLCTRHLLSAHAAALPGFVCEISTADPLDRAAFRVEGRQEQEFIEGLKSLVRDILLEPPRTSSAFLFGEPGAVPS